MRGLNRAPSYQPCEIEIAAITRSAAFSSAIRGRGGFFTTLRFPRFLALFDQFPKLARFAELLIFRDRQFAAEKEIAKRVLVQDAVNSDAFRRLGEVDPVIFRAVAI